MLDGEKDESFKCVLKKSCCSVREGGVGSRMGKVCQCVLVVPIVACVGEVGLTISVHAMDWTLFSNKG